MVRLNMLMTKLFACFWMFQIIWFKCKPEMYTFTLWFQHIFVYLIWIYKTFCNDVFVCLCWRSGTAVSRYKALHWSVFPQVFLCITELFIKYIFVVFITDPMSPEKSLESVAMIVQPLLTTVEKTPICWILDLCVIKH